jgi:hypothetical protein
MRNRLVLAGLVLAVVSAGCEDRRKKAIEQVGQDEAILRKVNGAVNEVIRNSPDCAVAKPLVTEAYGRIDEARAQVTLAASRQTLETLKVQVDRVAELCP